MFCPCVPEPERDCDDPPVPAVAHAGDHRLRAVEHAADVDREERIPVFGTCVSKVHRPHRRWDTRVVDEDVDRPRSGDRRLHRVEVGDVERQRRRPGSELGGRIHCPIRLQVVDVDRGAGVEQDPGDPEAHAAPCAGDERGSVVEVEHETAP